MSEQELQPQGMMRRYAFWILLSVELLLSFSFFGYFHIEPISVTIAYIPVLLAGALIGPLESVAVGALFGLASIWKASANYVMPADQLFSPFYSGEPLGSFMLSVGSRMLFGLVLGLLYMGARRLKYPGIWVAVVSYLGRTIHSLLVYSAMALFFPHMGYNPLSALKGLVNPVDIAVDLATALLVLALWAAVHTQTWRRFRRRLELARMLRSGERRYGLLLALVIVATLVSAVAVTLYFVHRIDYVLEGKGIELSDAGYSDALHLQMQFLLGIISLMMLVVLFLAMNREYTAYTAYEGKLDSLTGVMTRRAFFNACTAALRQTERQGDTLGYFIMVDLDYFKEINDTCGHPEGDRALKEVSTRLRDIFGMNCLIGRMGGDEFAVLVISAGETRAELEVDLRHFLERVHKTTCGERRLTCSIGALQVTEARPPEELYLEADRLLYAAKERGRDQYVIGRPEPAEEPAEEPAAV